MELGAEVKVLMHDQASLEDVKAWEPDRIILSPGPGRPENPSDFDLSAEILATMSEELPILGVCLGHQGLAQHFGARIVNAPSVVHGKLSTVMHGGQGLFAGVESPMQVMRYHSLMVEEASLPDCLEVSARTAGVIMALRHKSLPLYGIQFHPESIGTPEGKALLKNFLTS